MQVRWRSFQNWFSQLKLQRALIKINPAFGGYSEVGMQKFGMLFIFLQLAIFLSTYAAALPTYCAHLPISQSYVEAEANLKSRLDKFANHPLIAAEADRVLSQLLAAKSPAIVEWMGKRDFAQKSENEVVREWRRYYATTFTLQKYPSQNPKVNALIEELVEKVYTSAIKAKEASHLIKIFSEAKNKSLQTIARMHLSESDSKSIQKRIKAIELNFLKKLKDSAFAKNPLEAISWGVAYDPVPNRINIGIEELKYNGDASLFAVFAHEIGHSFDSCRWGAFFQNSFPFAQVAKCLRTPESVNAKVRDDSKLDAFLAKGMISKETAASLKANPTCNLSQYPTNGLQADQSLEAFADWFSAEVVAESTYLKAGLRSDLCEANTLQEGSSYLSNQMRLERIYLVQPKLSTLGPKGTTPARYCEPPNTTP